MSLNSDIKTIISQLTPPTLYLRAATLNEANVELPRIELSGPIAIHADLPTITNTQNASDVTRETTVNVMFLTKNTNQDDTGEEIDVIVDAMTLLADQFYDRLAASVPDTTNITIEEYTLEAVPTYQFSDEILTGVMLELNFPERRTVYYCP